MALVYYNRVKLVNFELGLINLPSETRITLYTAMKIKKSVKKQTNSYRVTLLLS